MKRRFDDLLNESLESFDDAVLDEVFDMSREFINEEYDVCVKIGFLLKTSTLIKARFVVENLIKKRESVFEGIMKRDSEFANSIFNENSI